MPIITIYYKNCPIFHVTFKIASTRFFPNVLAQFKKSQIYIDKTWRFEQKSVWNKRVPRIDEEKMFRGIDCNAQRLQRATCILDAIIRTLRICVMHTQKSKALWLSCPNNAYQNELPRVTKEMRVLLRRTGHTRVHTNSMKFKRSWTKFDNLLKTLFCVKHYNEVRI